tara:strand:- start:1482 stop:1883 length:402 start_codon:yes stop_codon:yes gene_type:complete
MDPNIWGSHAWLFLHTVTLNYPDEPTRFDKENYKHFFENLGHVIPCEVCKDHYKQNIRKYPIQLDSKESLTKWLHHIHNLVNIKNGKDEFKYDDFIKKYSNLYSGNNTQKVFLLILFIIVCITLFYLYKNYKK